MTETILGSDPLPHDGVYGGRIKADKSMLSNLIILTKDPRHQKEDFVLADQVQPASGAHSAVFLPMSKAYIIGRIYSNQRWYFFRV